MRKLAIVACLASSVLAETGITPVEVKLGKTIEVKVGYARGFFCNDSSLVDAELITRDDTNYWRVTGKKLGTTQCKVGSALHSPVYYVFEIRVVDQK